MLLTCDDGQAIQVYLCSTGLAGMSCLRRADSNALTHLLLIVALLVQTPLAHSAL